MMSTLIDEDSSHLITSEPVVDALNFLLGRSIVLASWRVEPATRLLYVSTVAIAVPPATQK